MTNGNEALLKERHADDPVVRREWLDNVHRSRYSRDADQWRDTLKQWYGTREGNAVKYAEFFEICEYGRRPAEDEIRQLFPFYPSR
jgi:hypothetical protein